MLEALSRNIFFLSGTPAYTGCVQETLKRAEREAQIYKEAGLVMAYLDNEISLSGTGTSTCINKTC